jgi:hypothetical protein
MMTKSSGEAWTPSGPRFFPCESAGHLGIAAGAHHHDRPRIPRTLHRGTETLGDGQHGGEHDDHPADPDDRDDRGAQPLRDRLQGHLGHGDRL